MVGLAKEEIHELVAAVQNYEWGIMGSNSLVAKLSEANSGAVIDEGKAYAEVVLK